MFWTINVGLEGRKNLSFTEGIQWIFFLLIFLLPLFGLIITTLYICLRFHTEFTALSKTWTHHGINARVQFHFWNYSSLASIYFCSYLLKNHSSSRSLVGILCTHIKSITIIVYQRGPASIVPINFSNLYPLKYNKNQETCQNHNFSKEFYIIWRISGCSYYLCLHYKGNNFV